jgi:hypothetical protein
MIARLAKIAIPVAILAALYYVFDAPYTNWSGFLYFALGFALAVHFAVLARGWGRNTLTVVASLLFFLAGAEAVAIFSESRPIDIRPRGYSASRPELGWGPEYPGTFRQVKLAAGTRETIFDVSYTIDAHRNRAVTSTETGPTVAFFGDSMTFGTGLNDTDTLPQQFAELTGRKFHVVNLAFPGYGPQQMLRALEVGLQDDVLKNPRLFVYQTAAWHAERAACVASFVLRAPRYILVNGEPVYQGTCFGNFLPAMGQLIANTSLFRVFISRTLRGTTREDVELDIAMMIRAGKIAREKYGAPLAILYLPTGRGYLERAGITEPEIMDRLRAGGLIVVDGGLKREDFGGQPLAIPGDGHPTGIANRARAEMLVKVLAGLAP